MEKSYITRDPRTVQYFYDTEFLDKGDTVELISIGIACTDGRTYHAHVGGYDLAAAWVSPFLARNVLPHLEDMEPKRRDTVAEEVKEFLYADPRIIDLWGWFPAYDHLLLSNLYGGFLKTPVRLPKRTNCVAQHAQTFRATVPPVSTSHSALSDAIETMEAFEHIEETIALRGGRVTPF